MCTNLCLFCNNPTSNPKFCNRSCSASYNNFRRSDESRKAQRQKLLGKKYGNRLKYTRVSQCQECLRYFAGRRKTCSKECYLINRSKFQSNRLRTDCEYRRKLGTANRSYMERSFESWLQRNFSDLPVVPQKPFRNKENNGYYYADFYFPTLNLIIELDGTHHNTQQNRSHDIKRDLHLRQRFSVKIVRITAREYRAKSRMSEVVELLTIQRPGVEQKAGQVAS